MVPRQDGTCVADLWIMALIRNELKPGRGKKRVNCAASGKFALFVHDGGNGMPWT